MPGATSEAKENMVIKFLKAPEFTRGVIKASSGDIVMGTDINQGNINVVLASLVAKGLVKQVGESKKTYHLTKTGLAKAAQLSRDDTAKDLGR